MYEVAAQKVVEEFGAYVKGARLSLACVLSERTLEAPAKTALEKALESLGYKQSLCSFIVLNCNTAHTLDEKELFFILEGLDPRCLIATDTASAEALSQTYRSPISLNASGRLFGRDLVAFESFSALLDTPQHKQEAWALLKRLPKHS